ncbi:hypothetical protein G5714_006181 [Onychostoma macrolepis]|uniref:Uncharacterized protein n=1 Tax=Onychostoma macrolepis TaxID=369639 RepID=A0A7J6D347_9TELE|nr:hypothetical protein G5714_006181 [Onychostoma macrolepis]
MAAIVDMDDLSGQYLYQKRPRPVGENQRSLHVISEEPHTPNPVLFIKGRALDAETLSEIMMEGGGLRSRRCEHRSTLHLQH